MNPYYYNPNDPKVATVMDAIMDFGRDYIKNNYESVQLFTVH